ncbi:MAG: hypothetical protein R2863_09820 [Candidatus Kapaibacterium sp.]
MEDVRPVYSSNGDTSVMSVKDWVITLLITAIPLVGFIMLFIWGFGSDTNANKRNWAKGTLILLAIVTVLYFIVFVVFMGLIFSGGSELSDSLRELENMN